jgi:Rab proteins geranylgeranyltransferase component A
MSSEFQVATALDEEGLLKHYDVVVCGTGLVQSIVASAVARCKKTVLHVDGSDHYGCLEAVWTLPYLQSLWKAQTINSANDAKTSAAAQPSADLGDSELPVGIVDTGGENNCSVVRLHLKGPLDSIQFHSMERKTSFPVLVGSVVQTSYGKGKVVALESKTVTPGFASLVVDMIGWKLANGTLPRLYASIALNQVEKDQNSQSSSGLTIADSVYLWQNHGIRTEAAAAAETILDRQSRSLALDVTPYLLYASGPAVDGLLVSSVSDYVEFKSLEGLLLASRTAGNMDNDIVLSRVPCSKNDVFSTKLLSPMDKRRLMKFLQTAMDFATAEALRESPNLSDIHEHDGDPNAATTTVASAVEELQHWNDRHLQQGRSLQRPQNKAVASTDLQQLQELCQSSSSSSSLTLQSYLRDYQKLSEPLTTLVRYALALDTADGTATVNATELGTDASLTIATGMKQLCAHLLALGRFGATAFLVPLYGSGELAQAFCRSAAVHGATYLLRRAPLGIVTHADNGNIQGILLEGRSTDPSLDDNETACAPTKRISCAHIVVPHGALYSNQRGTSPRRVLRRVSVLCGRPLRGEGTVYAQRHVVIFPPGTVSPLQTSTIHALLLDESVNVAPHVVGGCTVAHFTMTIDSTAADSHANDNNASEAAAQRNSTGILAMALEIILRNFRSNAGDDETVVEVFHTCFSYDLWTGESNNLDSTALSEQSCHIIERARPGLSADAAFEQAAAIFARICPGHDFLQLSAEMGHAIKAALGEHALEEEDEEKMVLDSAVADL